MTRNKKGQNKMEIQMEKLMQIVGEITVENHLYKQRIQDMTAQIVQMEKDAKEKEIKPTK